ncbi:MAG: ribonuclease R [Clostridia bacterium]|nr:ribonuclease R [Clostridia bacterium]
MNFRHLLLKRIKTDHLNEFTEKQIYNLLGIGNPFERKEFHNALDALIDEGYIFFDKIKRKYIIAEGSDAIKGKVSGNKRGFAFIICEDKNKPDLFVSHRNLRGAMHGDTVLCKLIGSGDSDEAEVLSVLRRGIEQVVGTYISSRGYGFVEPDDSRYYADIFITQKNSGGAKDGQKVVAKITDFPKDRKNPEGKIIEILGSSKDAKTDIISIIRSYQLYESFSENTEREAKKAAATDLGQLNNRKDFRELLTFTIDGEDAKDLDDAVSIYKEGDIYLLGVHIADVSHYVKQGSYLDKEALKRGTSVYFPDRVLPMLPQELSNGICSLNPNQDRLTLSVIMHVNGQGKVVKFEIAQSVIKSHARFTYTEIEKMLSGDKELFKKYNKFTDSINFMQELSDILISKRGRRGSIDFNLPEAQIIINNGEVEDIRPYPIGKSNKIIEEFMILTNETVAKYCEEKKLPFIYRIHEEPSEEKLYAFNRLISGLGYNLSGSEKPDPMHFAKLLDEIEGKPEFSLINKVMLRTMMKAKYSTVNSGHFGLASKCYCHFTSPIRRYPDLFIHRAIKAYLSNKMDEVLFVKAQDASLISSEREKLAIEAEREVEDYYKAKYMENFIGETFEGIISGVMEFGIFVELSNTVEGMIKTENLPGNNYNYFKDLYMIKNSKNTYKLGGKIKIKVERADARTKRIDFLPYIT